MHRHPVWRLAPGAMTDWRRGRRQPNTSSSPGRRRSRSLLVEGRCSPRQQYRSVSHQRPQAESAPRRSPAGSERLLSCWWSNPPPVGWCLFHAPPSVVHCRRHTRREQRPPPRRKGPESAVPRSNNATEPTLEVSILPAPLWRGPERYRGRKRSRSLELSLGQAVRDRVAVRVLEPR